MSEQDVSGIRYDEEIFTHILHATRKKEYVMLNGAQGAAQWLRVNVSHSCTKKGVWGVIACATRLRVRGQVAMRSRR